MMHPNTDGKPLAERISYPYISSQTELWNPLPLGKTLLLGNQQDRLITVNCTERCLRLAYKHALQMGKCDFEGFLLGTMEFNADGTDTVIHLDRFDPGVVSETSLKSPSALLPTDIVVPLQVVRASFQWGPSLNFTSKDHIEAALQMLDEAITGQNSIDPARSLAITLYCICDDRNLADDVLANIHFCWDVVFVSSTINITPIKSIPIIPTALAKTLSNSMNLLQQETVRTGILTMDQTRKLLLMLDSDPKVSKVPAIGIWISYMVSLYHPAVWMTCLRYLCNRPLYKRIFSKDNEFLLLVYSTPNSKPLFYKCCAGNGGCLSFDILSAEHHMQLQRHDQSHRLINVTLDYSPPDDSKERKAFLDAVESYYTSIPQPNRRGLNNSNNEVACSKVKRRQISEHLEAKTQAESQRQNSEAEPTPSPAPAPITRSAPATPSVLEPSMIFDESYRFRKQLQKSIRAPPANFTPARLLQQESADILAPSFCESNSEPTAETAEHLLYSNTTVKSIPTTSPPVSSRSASVNEKKEKRSRRISPSLTDHCFESSDFSEGQLHSRTTSPKPTSQVIIDLEKRPWFRKLPPEAVHFYAEQNKRILQLAKEIKELKKVQVSTNSTAQDTVAARRQYPSVDATTQVELSSVNVGVNTDSDVPQGFATTNPVSSVNKVTPTKTLEKSSDFIINETSNQAMLEEIPQDVLSIHSSEGEVIAEKMNSSDFSSIQLDSAALNEANNDQSLTSSLQAVDMPGLDITDDNTPTPRSNNMWSENSPILGESASMYLPSKMGGKDTNLSDSKETEEDQRFFGNLLKQVQEMLQKGDEEPEEEIATKSIDQSVNKHISALAYNTNLPDALVPHLACLGMFAPRGIMDNFDLSLLKSGNELSMHANAIALKYLSDEQLTNIATSNGKDTLPQLFSSTNTGLSSPSSSRIKQTICSGRYSGMSLLSPCNMSLATKKYMQKYGLVEIDELSDNGSDKENDKNFGNNLHQGQAQDSVQVEKNTTSRIKPNDTNRGDHSNGVSRAHKNNCEKSCSICSRRTSKSDSKAAYAGGGGMDKTQFTKAGPHWSQLENNLGETFDMLHPFLSDLEKKQQTLPNDHHRVSINQEKFSRSKPCSKELNGDVGDTVEQILSPRILKSLNKVNRNLKRYAKEQSPVHLESDKNSPESRIVEDASKNMERNPAKPEDDDSLLMPPPNGTGVKNRLPCKMKTASRGRSGSVDRGFPMRNFPPQETSSRRMSSSPTCSQRSYPQKVENDSGSYERVLDSHIMQAFHRDGRNNEKQPQDLSISEENSTLSSMDEENNENILNLNKIKHLPKLL